MAQHNWLVGMQKDDRTVALYDTDAKALIGIFSNACIASKFIYGIAADYKKSSIVRNTCKTKSKFRTGTTNLTFKATVRCATPAQIEQLGEKKYVFTGDVAPSVEFVQNIACKYRD